MAAKYTYVLRSTFERLIGAALGLAMGAQACGLERAPGVDISDVVEHCGTNSYAYVCMWYPVLRRLDMELRSAFSSVGCSGRDGTAKCTHQTTYDKETAAGNRMLLRVMHPTTCETRKSGLLSSLTGRRREECSKRCGKHDTSSC
jgi:hypothetical protein